MSDFTMYSDLIDDMYSPTEIKPTPECPCTERYNDMTLGLSTCIECGTCFSLNIYISDYKDYVKKPYQPYKRMSHFLKNVYSIRVKKHVMIPNTIIRFIKRKCKTLTPNNIRNLLKVSRLQKYIPYVNQIYVSISKTTLPHLMEQEINKMIYWFRQIDNSYNDHGKSRVNFFNYNFLIIKLLEKLNRHDCIAFYKPLKNRNRYEYQDKLYNEITKDLF